MEPVDNNSLLLPLNQLAQSINQMQSNSKSAHTALSVVPPPPPLPASDLLPASTSIRKSPPKTAPKSATSTKKQTRSEGIVAPSAFIDISSASATSKTKETINSSHQGTMISTLTNLLAQFSEHKQHVNIELAKINQKIDKYFLEHKEQTLAAIQPLLRPEINEVTKSRVQRVALEILKHNKTPDLSDIAEALRSDLSEKL